MSIKSKFVESNIKKPEIGRFLFESFGKYGYSHANVRKTHTGIDITVYANKPGLIIGRGGENINKVSDKLKKKFGFDNVRIDVQEIEKPYLNSKIVAEEIRSALERGINNRRIGSIMLRKVMESGAVGCEIRLAGKLGSAKARVQRFYKGYLKYSGETAKKYVDYSSINAVTKAGSIGIKVRIMKEYPEAKTREIKDIPEEKKGKQDLTCPYCGKVYDKERSLKIHIGQKHSEEESKKNGKKSEKEDESKKPEKKVEKPKKEKSEEKKSDKKKEPKSEKKDEKKEELKKESSDEEKKGE